MEVVLQPVSPNRSQLSALGLQTGAFCGACLVGLSANAAEWAGGFVLLSVVVGFICGGALGWVLAKGLGSMAESLPQGRPRNLLVAGVRRSSP